MQKKKWLSLSVALAIPLVGAMISSLFANDMKAVYQSLTQPSFAPPAWLFGPVWGVLYLMLGFASWLVWRSEENGEQRTRALTFYAVELLLNFLWTPIFFGLQQYRFAFWELCAMLVIAGVMGAYFAFQDKRTLWFTLPYIAWLVYAGALNRAIITLNM